MSDPERLQAWYRAALAAVNGREAVASALSVVEFPERSVHVLALGKAAEAMLEGASQVWSSAIAGALVVAPVGSAATKGVSAFPLRRQHGNHPVPGPDSLAAGEAVAGFLRAVPPGDIVLVLLSGGASSLAELPQPGVDLTRLQELNTRLLGAGIDIRTMNALRARFSRLKAGGALAFCPAADVRVLFISDVPGDAPASVGSGPFWPPSGSDVAARPPDLDWPVLAGLLQKLPAISPVGEATLPRPEHRLIAGNRDARHAVVEAARAEGLEVHDHGLFPEASEVSLVCRLTRLLRDAPDGVHVWGGEAPVRLPLQPGRGGRAQHLAALLLLLWSARGWPRPIGVLSAATDGVDGNSGSAGAWFGDAHPAKDSGTVVALRRAIRGADTASFWERLGQCVSSRETGTNVMDLLIVRLGPTLDGSRVARPEGLARPASLKGGALAFRGSNRASGFHAPGQSPRSVSARRRSAGVHAMALRALRVRDPERKCECVERLLEAWWRGGLGVDIDDAGPVRVEIPGRPESPKLVQPQDLPKRGLHTTAGRQALLHAVTHIEFNAINLALDAVYRFRDLPPEYISDWLQVAAEEARHFRMLARRLEATGSSYGALPAHNGLWEMAVKTDTDAMERMALVPRVLEARGLDVTPGMIRRLEAAGDAASVAVLRVIQREEVSHVAIGTRWFRHLARQRGVDPEQTFLELLARHMPGRVRPPFALDARLAAGFSRSEMAALEAQAETKGRPDPAG